MTFPRQSRPHAAGIAVAVLFAASAAGAQSERKTLTGSSVAIYNIVGHVEVVAGTGSNVEVEVERAGGDARKLSVEVGEIRGVNTLRVIYPDDDIVYRERGDRSDRNDRNDRWGSWNTTFSVRSDGTWGDDRGDRRGWFSSGRRVKVKGSGSGTEAWANLRILVPAGKHVDVNLGVGELSATRVTGDLRLDAASARIKVEGTKGNLTVDAGSGGVEVRDANGDEISLNTGSGGVTATGVTGKRCKLDTGSGGLMADGIDCDEITMDVGSGSVGVRDAKANRVKVEAGSGGIRLALRNSPKYLDVNAGSGGVTISLPAIVNAEIDIETGSGGIDSDFPVEVNRMERNRLRGKVGDGSGRFRIESGSGSVRLRKS